MLCRFCFSHRNFGCFHLVCLIVPSTFVIFTIGITVICNIICLWMGNLYAATPGQNPGVARIYIYIYITLRFTWATQSSELLADNNSQRNLLSNKPGNRYNGLSDSWDSALPASLFSGSLLSNSPKKTHQSSVNAVTPCNRMQWLYVIVNHCCAQLWMQRGETGKKCAYSRLPKMSSCSQCGIKIQFAKEWRHAASWKSWNMKHLKSERIWGVKEQWNYVKFAGITPGVPPVYWWRVTQRTTGEQHGTTCWTT